MKKLELKKGYKKEGPVIEKNAQKAVLVCEQQ